MTDTFTDLLETYSPDIQAICGSLRAVILKAAPEAVELYRPDQKHLAYVSNTPRENEILLLAPKRNFVLLVFKGSKGLKDSDGLLGSDGKEVRFMTVNTVEEANNPQLSNLIGAAWTNAS